VITPNIPEAERISGLSIKNEKDIESAAGIMRSMGAGNVLIKGGHPFDGDVGTGQHENAPRYATDHLFIGERTERFEAEYIDTTSTHGTGCTLAAAITANLALGKDLVAAVRISKKFVTDAIRTAPGLGHGHSPIDI
jgi:hydroxymethylpyrimidine kinase/phosphomethylpyrimidine kinase